MRHQSETSKRLRSRLTRLTKRLPPKRKPKRKVKPKQLGRAQQVEVKIRHNKRLW